MSLTIAWCVGLGLVDFVGLQVFRVWGSGFSGFSGSIGLGLVDLFGFSRGL